MQQCWDVPIEEILLNLKLTVFDNDFSKEKNVDDSKSAKSALLQVARLIRIYSISPYNLHAAINWKRMTISNSYIIVSCTSPWELVKDYHPTIMDSKILVCS